jgi:hypothetical protein
MPKTEIDYSNTIIYKITCKDKTITDVYVGHTTNFVQRKHGHKQSCINNKSLNHNCKLYEVIRANGGWANWKMEIINFFECADHYEARKKEQEYFIALNATLNSVEPFPKPKILAKKPIISLPQNNPEDFTTINCSSQKTCEICSYTCADASNFKKHINTEKHKTRVSEQIVNKSSCDENNYKCKICNKGYKNRNGLWYHNKKCKKEPIESDKDVINLLINETKDFKNIILDLVKSNTELQKQMLEVCKGSIKS